MAHTQSKEEKELDLLYPAGSREREVLEYSREVNPQKAVHPMLVMAFGILMVLTAVAVAIYIVTFLKASAPT